MIVANATMIAMQAPTANHGNQRRLELFDVGTPVLGIVGETVLDIDGCSPLGVAIGP